MAQYAVIGFPRWTPICTFTAAGSTAAGYPASNLSSLPLSRVWRSASLSEADLEVRFTLAAQRPIQGCALCRHNLSRAAEFRLRLYQDTALTTLLTDTGWGPVWPVIYPLGTLGWLDGGLWDGVYADEEIAGSNWHRPIWLPDVFDAAGGILTLRDPSNTAGFVQMGMLDVFQGWQVASNFDFGADYGFRSRTQVTEAPGGAKVFQRRRKPRIWRGTFRYMARDEALARGFELQRRADLEDPFMWFPRPDDQLHWLREAWLARHADLPLFSSALVDHDHMPLSLEEVLE